MKQIHVLFGLIVFTMVAQAQFTLERSICGSDDMEDMSTLDDAMKSMGTPIGILRTDGGMCSGTLVSKDLFLTAGHCKSDCNSMEVSFGYVKGREETFGCKSIVEANSSGTMNLDYMLIRLQGSPGVQWGWYDMSAKDTPDNTNLLIIQHPQGLPMKVARKNCSAKRSSGGMLYHSCDTQPGTSGSGVIVPDYEKPVNSRIVAVHAYGGCNAASTQFNSGATIKNLLSVSPTIKSMVKDD